MMCKLGTRCTFSFANYPLVHTTIKCASHKAFTGHWRGDAPNTHSFRLNGVDQFAGVHAAYFYVARDDAYQLCANDAHMIVGCSECAVCAP
jgi:hypothetical protein